MAETVELQIIFRTDELTGLPDTLPQSVGDRSLDIAMECKRRFTEWVRGLDPEADISMLGSPLSLVELKPNVAKALLALTNDARASLGIAHCVPSL